MAGRHDDDMALLVPVSNLDVPPAEDRSTLGPQAFVIMVQGEKVLQGWVMEGTEGGHGLEKATRDVPNGLGMLCSD